MKKSYLLGIIASAALAMTGCSSDEMAVNEGGNAQAIEFGTYVGRDAQVRSANAITGLSDLQKEGNGFGVFAFYTGTTDFNADSPSPATPNFMNNQKVTWNKTKNVWEYSPLKYWPNNTGDKVSFFAYAPYADGKTWAEGNKIAYTVENDVKKQVDLLFCAGQTNKTKQNITDKVSFEFKHALARIGFSVAYAVDQVAAGGTLDANTKITINKVVLRKKGATSETEGVFYKSGNLTLTAANADAAWADPKVAQAFTLVSGDNGNFTANELNSTTSKIDQLNKADSYVMIIPQKTDFEVYVEYTVTTTDTSLTGGKSEIVNKITTPVSSIDFKANKAYTLDLVLGMTSVKVDATFTDWEIGTPANTTVDVPANTKGNTISAGN